jgi:hypothetical protein
LVVEGYGVEEIEGDLMVRWVVKERMRIGGVGRLGMEQLGLG